MAAPRQMIQNTLNALKGWPSPYAVDYVAELSSDVTQDPVLSGTCVRLDSDGKFKLGVGSFKVMPMFLFPDSDDPDVSNDGGDPTTDKGVFVGIIPPRRGPLMALVACGAYELTSTEFVTDTYAPNDHLTSADGSGKLSKGTVYTDTIVGVVSRGVVDNGYGFNALAFWPWYIPPT